MKLLVAWDIAASRWINQDIAHPALDPVMRFLSTNPVFVPATVLLAFLLLWKGGVRGIVFLAVLAVGVGLANELLVEPLKAAFSRPRPFVALEDFTLRVGRGSPYASMPSGHALLSAVIATIAAWYYRRLVWVVVPIAIGVALSRVYNGVHFISDVMVGLVLGASFAALVLWGGNRLWLWLAPKWSPYLARRVGSLLHPGVRRDRDALPHAPQSPQPSPAS